MRLKNARTNIGSRVNALQGSLLQFAGSVGISAGPFQQHVRHLVCPLALRGQGTAPVTFPALGSYEFG